jgi:YVTN family beta-propeller protein
MMVGISKTAHTPSSWLVRAVRYTLPLLMGWLALPASAHDAHVYVSNAMASSISVIDTKTNTISSTIALGFGPANTAFNPDGSKAYVLGASDYNSGFVSVIDTATQSVIATIAVGHEPIGISITPDGSQLYVSNVVDNTVSVINTATNAVTNTIAVGNSPWYLSVNADGSKAYVLNQSDSTLSVISTATNTVINTISIGDSLWAMAASQNDNRLYVLNFDDYTISVIDTSNDTVIATITDPNPNAYFYGNMGISLDGSRIYAQSGYNTVAAIDTTNYKVVAEVTVGNAPESIAFTADGKKAYVANMNDNTVSVIDTAKNSVITTLATGNYPTSVAVQPAPSHTLHFYLHGRDIPGTAGGLTMNQNHGPEQLLTLPAGTTTHWFSDPVLTGNFAAGANFSFQMPCTFGLSLGTTFSLAKTDLDGKNATKLGSAPAPLLCLVSPATVTIPVTAPVSFANQRLRLSIHTALPLIIGLPADGSSSVRATSFSGTP